MGVVVVVGVCHNIPWGGGGVISLIEQFEGRKVNTFPIIIAIVRHSPWNPVNILYLSATDELFY
jgi:hypothetical protein